MTHSRRILFSLLVSAAVWTLFTWPLARYITGGIPSSAHRDDCGVREMVPGDHLQLLYHFWLFGDMIRGKTPWFTNLYEFNTGNDEERFELTYNFLPFSLICGVTGWFTGPALAWNLTGLFSIWITYLATWLLVLRYTRDEWIAAVAGLMGIALTYRWIALLGGSPTGFGMMWTPLLLLGLDMAVRDSDARGGWLAGITIFFAGISDTHVYFFLVLVTPFWCALSFVVRADWRWSNIRSWLRLALALSPVALLAGGSVLFSKLLSRELSGSVMARGRSLGEVAGFSPGPEGFFSLASGRGAQVYIGYTLALLVAIGFIALCVRAARRRDGESVRRLVFFLLLAALMYGIAILALGPHGPNDAAWFVRVRKWIPPYAMIRQAGKIFCLMPQLTAVALGLSLTALLAHSARPRNGRAALLVVAAAILIEYPAHVHPSIVLLRNEQAAYAAVAEDAEARGEKAHALIIVLWPGDSHYASVYEHYVSRYRIRMVNGYRPAVTQQYRDSIFWYYQTINQGHLTDQQADDLLAMGVRHILVHEDLFPEQVSPLPVTFTLRQLLNHPRLEFLKQADRVWAFRLRDTPAPGPDPVPAWNRHFPARLWEVEQSRHHESDTMEDIATGGGRYLALNRPDAAVLLTHTTSPPAPNLRWMIRTRGDGRLLARNMNRDDAMDQTEIDVQSADWTWIEHPLSLDEQLRVSLRLEWLDGEVDLDMALLTAGEWQPPAAGESLELPAPLFFHAGYSDFDSGEVVFDPRTEPCRRIFYGPRLPLDTGRYEVEWRYESAAEPGTNLGRLRIESAHGGEKEILIDVVAGEPATVTIDRDTNLPFTLSFDYSREARVRVSGVTIRKLE